MCLLLIYCNRFLLKSFWWNHFTNCHLTDHMEESSESSNPNSLHSKLPFASLRNQSALLMISWPLWKEISFLHLIISLSSRKSGAYCTNKLLGNLTKSESQRSHWASLWRQSFRIGEDIAFSNDLRPKKLVSELIAFKVLARSLSRSRARIVLRSGHMLWSETI